MTTVKQLAPHWLVMFLLMIAVTATADFLFGPLPFWLSLGLVIAVAVVYPSVVRRLGVAPAVWQR
ncbi:hypothetical protein ACNS7O_05880 [Haloferacaceae archaeon DSL9]